MIDPTQSTGMGTLDHLIQWSQIGSFCSNGIKSAYRRDQNEIICDPIDSIGALVNR